jgi:hypothetical protein
MAQTNLFGKMLMGFIGSVMSGIGVWMMLIAFLGILAGSILATLVPNLVYSTVVFALLGVAGLIAFLYGMKIYFENINFIAKLVIGLVGIYIILLGVGVGLILAAIAPATAGISLAAGVFAMLVSISTGYAFVHIGFGIKLMPYLDKMIDTFFKFTAKAIPKLR